MLPDHSQKAPSSQDDILPTSSTDQKNVSGDDFLLFAELTATKLFTVLYASCRAYQDILALEEQTLQLGKALSRQEKQNEMQSNFFLYGFT